MRIPNLTMSDALVTRLNTINIKQGQYNDQISNGQRISLASEDPQAAGRILRLQSERSAIDSYTKNAERALGISQASFAALNRLKDISDRATELAALSISGNVSAEERKAYAVEVSGCRFEATGGYYNEATGALSGSPLTLRAYYLPDGSGSASALKSMRLRSARRPGAISPRSRKP